VPIRRLGWGSPVEGPLPLHHLRLSWRFGCALKYSDRLHEKNCCVRLGKTEMPGFGEKTAEVKLTGAKRREWMGLGVAGMICLIVSQWIIPSFPPFR